MRTNHSPTDGTFAVALIGALLGGLSFLLSILLTINLFRTEKFPQIDAMSWSMSVLQTFLAVCAIGGFWMIRGAAILHAKETAEAEAKRIEDGLKQSAIEAAKNDAIEAAREAARASAERYISEFGDEMLASHIESSDYIKGLLTGTAEPHGEQTIADAMDMQPPSEE
ncbi:MAG TPA: hypothetical protein PLH11_11700 [Gemmobacter sp.]|nr:hypothetical protein [Gemmobacter sp.]